MKAVCYVCKNELENDDEISFLGQGRYKKLKSQVVGAISAASFDLAPETLAHIRCPDED